jgi:hypothetical protein
MHDRWFTVWVRLGLLLGVAASAGCQRGGDEPNPLRSGSEGPTNPVPVISASAAADDQAWADDEVFTGTNLLEGVRTTLRQPEPLTPADNSYCYVCHANYKEEELTISHQVVGVGCELCHGMSDEHSADEDGLTPPEILWPKAWINVTCMECHPHDELAREVSHEEFLARTLPEQVCTDCHGEGHRMSVRTRVWDRMTGKLIACDGVRMMDADSPAGAAR